MPPCHPHNSVGTGSRPVRNSGPPPFCEGILNASLKLLLLILIFQTIHKESFGNSLASEIHSSLKSFLNFTMMIPAVFKHFKLGINLNESKIFSNLSLVSLKFSQNELINPELSVEFEFDLIDSYCL